MSIETSGEAWPERRGLEGALADEPARELSEEATRIVGRLTIKHTAQSPQRERVRRALGEQALHGGDGGAKRDRLRER
jgi:hypothetical protein